MATHEDDFGNGEVFRTGFESDPEEPVEDVAPANGKHGDVLSAYNVHETIGAGSFGKVKKATKRSTGEIVAIKIIDKKLIGDVEDVMRYTREFAILANLNHKNIIKLHEVTQSDIYFYVIMDLCEGNLQDIISRDGIEPPLDLMSESVDGTDLASCPKAQKKVLPEDVVSSSSARLISPVHVLALSCLWCMGRLFCLRDSSQTVRRHVDTLDKLSQGSSIRIRRMSSTVTSSSTMCW